MHPTLIPLLKTHKKTLVNEQINLLHRYLTTRKKAKNSTLALVLDHLRNRQRSTSDLDPLIITYINIIVILFLKYCCEKVVCYSCSLWKRKTNRLWAGALHEDTKWLCRRLYRRLQGCLRSFQGWVTVEF